MRRKSSKTLTTALAPKQGTDDQNVSFEANLGFPVGYAREESFGSSGKKHTSAADIEEIFDYLRTSL